RPAAGNPGLLFYIMVDSVAATIDTVLAHGGEIVQPIGADAPETTARFRDPGGNVIGLYQHPASGSEQDRRVCGYCQWLPSASGSSASSAKDSPPATRLRGSTPDFQDRHL